MDATNAVLWIQRVLTGVKANVEDASFCLRYQGASVAEFFNIDYEPSTVKSFHIEGKACAIGGRIEVTEQGWWVTRVDYYCPVDYFKQP